MRTKMTENERIAQNKMGINTESVNFNMAEGRIDEIIQKEKINKFNDEVEQYVERIKDHTDSLKENTNKLSYDITKLEIKPMFNRILITLFNVNPFQKITTTESGIITDLGGMNPTYKNTDSGETEIADQIIVVGVIQEIGPEVKYARPGDTVFIDKHSIRPVPFYKQGFYCLAENQIIAIVNEELEKRFREING